MATVAYDKIDTVASFSITDTDAILQYVRTLPHTDACIVSSVSEIKPLLMKALIEKAPYFIELTAGTPIPIRNLYQTPETLGKDRLAAVVGAHSLYSGRNVLVIDAGTALTIDFIDGEGNYHGGNISPGLKMRFQSLHDYTKRLPLLIQSNEYKMIGDSTEAAIIAGVQNGIIFEVKEYIERFTKQYPDLVAVMTGGDVNFLVDKLKIPIFVESNLVFIGLGKIIQYNISKRKKN